MITEFLSVYSRFCSKILRIWQKFAVEYCSYKGLTPERPIFSVLEVVMLNIVLIKDLYCACLSIKKRSIATS